MSITKYECYGGPIDGQTLPPPSGLPAFGTPDFGSMLIHLDRFGHPHFYELMQHFDEETRKFQEVLVYRGCSTKAALQHIYEQDPEMADALAKDLEQIMTAGCEPENFDSDNIVGWCKEEHAEEDED